MLKTLWARRATLVTVTPKIEISFESHLAKLVNSVVLEPSSFHARICFSDYSTYSVCERYKGAHFLFAAELEMRRCLTVLLPTYNSKEPVVCGACSHIMVNNIEANTFYNVKFAWLTDRIISGSPELSLKPCTISPQTIRQYWSR